MSFKDTIRVVQSGGRRIKIFVDFWNVVINARKQAEKLDIEVRWDALAEQILQETHRGYGDETSGELAGCYIFGSCARSDPKEAKFIKRTLDKYGSMSGLFFEFKERVRKQTSDKCQQCGTPMSRSSELGVDVLLAVEMIKHATMRDHEYLALVSGDRDYIPLLSFLKDQGQRVIHVATGEPHRDMRSLTWKQVELTKRYPYLCSIAHDKYFIITAPAFAEQVAEAQLMLDEQGLGYDVIDITNKEENSDKDLLFVLRNQRMFFRKKDDDARQSYSAEDLYQSLVDRL
jgi:uncharacterized LabA/DUF88 family protein